MRVVDREQAKVVAGFQSVRRVNRRLLALVQSGLLKRFFIGTVAGGKKALYSLSPLGANFVQVPCRGPRRRNDEAVTVDFFVYHQLGINDIYCALKYHAIPLVGTRLIRWESFDRPIDAQASLRPDGYLEVQSHQKTIAAFLEFDLGHESLTVWKGKVDTYLRYAVSGEFEHVSHEPQFRVIVVTNTERRRETLRRTTAAITEKVFWFTTTDSIHHHGFWSPIWFRPTGDQEPISFL
jgi:Replication-relaxation